jgi:hypothetical protein
VIDLEVLAEVGDGERRADASGEHVDELFYEADLADALQVAQIVMNHAGKPLALPEPMLRLVRSEERLGKAAEAEERVEVGAPPGRLELG